MELAFLFKKHTPVYAMNKALGECNVVLLDDFGPRHRIEPSDAPDLLVVCYDNFFESNDTNKAVGLLTLHYTEASRAWEVGTVSVRKVYSHDVIFHMFMERVSDVIVENFMNEDDTPAAAWLVRRVKQHNRLHINTLKSVGFEEPAHFMIGVLSNDGYIPFDPFDEVLMKRRICPPALAQLEATRADSVVFNT